MEKNAKYYWIRLVTLILITALAYSIYQFSLSKNSDSIYLQRLKNERNTRDNKESDNKNTVLHLSQSPDYKVIPLHGGIVDLSAEATIYFNRNNKKASYIDITYLKPLEDIYQYILWVKSGDTYRIIKELTPNDALVEIILSPSGTSYLITKETGATDTPNLQQVVASS